MLPFVFTYSNPFRSLDVFGICPLDEQAGHDWTVAEIDQEFYIENSVAGFGTGQDVDYEITIQAIEDFAAPLDCYAAIVVPLKIEKGQLYIRGGYSDQTVAVPSKYSAIGFFEMPKQKIVLNLFKSKPVELGLLVSSKSPEWVFEYDEKGLISSAKKRGAGGAFL